MIKYIESVNKTLHMPNLKDWVIGLLMILVSLSSYFTEKVGIKQLAPIHIIIYSILAVFAISFFRSNTKSAAKGLKNTAAIISLLLSQFITIGQSVYYVHDWSMCFGGWKNVLVWIIQSFFFGFVIYKIVLGLLCYISNYSPQEHSIRINHLKVFGLSVATRGLYLLAFYPCVFGFDAAVGLRTLLDPDCATCAHHPYFIQLIHGAFYSLGLLLGHKSLGFGILSVLLIIASSAIITYGIRLHQQAGVSRKWLIGIVLIYSLLPVFPYLSVYPTKDGLFAYSFLLYSYSLYEIYLSHGQSLKGIKFCFLHGLSILLVCLTRHQGLYLVVIETFALAFSYKSFLIRILPTILTPLALSICFSKIIMPAYDVEPAGKQEMYGTLFQQTALYLQKHPGDITVEERSAINAILDADTITSKYTYNISDPVKNVYKYNPWYRVTPQSPSMFRHIDHTGEQEALAAYRSAWLSMHMRHPLTYVEATTYICIGFFYNCGQPLILTEPRWAENRNATTPEYAFWHVNKVAKYIDDTIKPLTRKPILSWFLAIPYYMWVALILTALLLYRKDIRAIVVFLPFILSIGILVICPIAFGRYIFPIVIILPLLLLHLLSSKKCQE